MPSIILQSTIAEWLLKMSLQLAKVSYPAFCIHSDQFPLILIFLVDVNQASLENAEEQPASPMDCTDAYFDTELCDDGEPFDMIDDDTVFEASSFESQNVLPDYTYYCKYYSIVDD